MKSKSIGVLKLGGRLTWDSKDRTGGLGEAKSICELLSHIFQINVYTKLLAKEDPNPMENINIYEIKETEDIIDDHLFVFNGNVNFFGGAEDPEQIKNYKLINSFKGTVYYIWIDPELYLKQIWPSMSKKEWVTKYMQEDIEIIRDDIEIITSIYNINSAYDKYSKGKTIIKKENIHYFPFQKYPLLETGLSPSKNLEYDLMYMGTFRSGRRQDKMIKYYFGHNEVKSTFIGKTKLKDFKKQYSEPVPEFLPPVNFSDIRYEINKTLAHINIGDKFYEGNIITPRIYECINFSTVCLIDRDMDPKKMVFNNDTLQKFCYINSLSEAKERLIKLKNDPEFRLEILSLQKKDTAFSTDNYINDLCNILGYRNSTIDKWR